MSVGYRVFGFCNGKDCYADTPIGIRHDDLTQFHGLKRNLRRIIAEDHGWTVGIGDKDYCQRCSAKRKELAQRRRDRR